MSMPGACMWHMLRDALCCVVGKDTQWQMELVGRLDALAGAVVDTGGRKVRDVNEV